MKTPLVAILAGALLVAAHSASAQSRDPYFSTFSANYDFLYGERNAASHDGPFFDITSHAGAHFDFASTFKRDVPFVGPVAEVGFNHFEGATIVSVMGGVRVRIPANDRQVLPFAQGLVGLYHCGVCNTNDLAIQGGGGVDFRVSNTRDFRIRTQLEFRHVFHENFSVNAVRLSAGIVLPLNK